MLRSFFKQTFIAFKKYPPKDVARALSSVAGKISLKVKINQQNETFEMHEVEVEAAGKQKIYEFPFVYLRDNCQVSIVFSDHHHHRI